MSVEDKMLERVLAAIIYLEMWNEGQFPDDRGALRQLRATLAPLGEWLEANRGANARALFMAQGGEPHWLIQDFNVLYRCAAAFSDACEGKGDGKPYGPHLGLKAQLERLKPAFTDTEAVSLHMQDPGPGGPLPTTPWEVSTPVPAGPGGPTETEKS